MTQACAQYAGRDLPALLQRAITRLMDSTFPLDINLSQKCALAEMLRRVEARDGVAEFRIRREQFAGLFAVSERSVTGWIEALEDAGGVVRDQRRTRMGEFSCIVLNLTPECAALLGLDPGSPPCPRFVPGQKFADGHKESFTNAVFQRQQPTAPALVDNVLKKGQVPDDCKMLLELGIRPSGVFSLMAMASRQGKRLGAILVAKEAAIKAARAAFGYVASLIHSNTDFGAAVTAVAEAAEISSQKAKIASKKRELDRQHVSLPDGRIALCSADLGVTLYHQVNGSLERLKDLVGGQIIRFWQDAATQDWRPFILMGVPSSLRRPRITIQRN